MPNSVEGLKQNARSLRNSGLNNQVIKEGIFKFI